MRAGRRGASPAFGNREPTR